MRPVSGRAAVLRASGVVCIAVVGAIASGSCGVPRETGFQPLASDEVPFRIGVTTTTAPAPATPSGPTTDVPVTVTTARSTGPRPSSTLVATEPVKLYFATAGNHLTAITTTLPHPTSLRRAIAALETGPLLDDAGVQLQSFVQQGLVLSVTDEGGVALVDLDGELLTRIDSSDQRLLIAQLVLTLATRPGIGQVSFSADGDPISVPVPSRDNLLSEAGEPVSFDEFEELVAIPSDEPGPSPTSTDAGTGASRPDGSATESSEPHGTAVTAPTSTPASASPIDQ